MSVLSAEKFAAERHRRLRNEVSMADHDRIEPEPVGDHVDEPLAYEARLETSRRAIGTARRLIGQAHMADRTVRGNYVRARQHCAGKIDDGDTVRAEVASLVEPELVVEAQNEAVLVDRRAHPMGRASRLVRRHQMLVTVLDSLDRPPEPQRRRTGQNVLGIELAANAEAAADMPIV